MATTPTSLDPKNYAVGWICAISTEQVAAREFLDEEYGRPEHVSQHDNNVYLLGRVGRHDVVIASLPDAEYGTTSAATVARDMLHSFPNVRIGLMVGVGGGAPSRGHDIRLGDVVVSSPSSGQGGVYQYDFGKTMQTGKFCQTGILNQPPVLLRSAVASIKAQHEADGHQLDEAIGTILNRKPRLKKNYSRPEEETDRLYDAAFTHQPGEGECNEVCGTEATNLVPRQARGVDEDNPAVHYGLIASANQVMKDATVRDTLVEEKGVLCFEMEAAGLMNHFPCLVIRGICDYADSHKNKRWQGYAAMVAAAYAKDILSRIAPNRVEHETRVADTMATIDQRNKCIRDIRLTDPRHDKQRIEESKGGLLRDAYSWVLQDHRFQQWRHAEQSSILWIKGDPGKGKTMLLCGIINNLEQSNTRVPILSYFFCQATDRRLNNAIAVLRGLIFMFVQQEPSLASHILAEYNTAGKSLFEGPNAWYALVDILQSMLKDKKLDGALVVVDALDECSTDQRKLLNFILTASSTCSRIMWLVSSRNWTQIENVLGGSTQTTKLTHCKLSLSLELNAASVTTAVQAFIKQRVSELAQQNGYDELTQRDVLEYVTSNADNTFLWVALVCQNLQATAKRNVSRKLKSFPPGLDALYDRMMQQISKTDDAELCKQVLAAVGLVYRPITLKEIVTLVEPLEGMAEDSELPEIISLCGSFLTLRGQVVYFVHQSAKDFLLANAAQQVFPAGREAAHQAMFARSLQIMSTTLRRDIYGLKVLGTLIDDVQIPKPDPLSAMRYSCVHWVDHLCDSNPTSSATFAEILRDRGVVHEFLREKCLYWLESLSLCRSMSKAVVSMRKLQRLVQEQGETTPFTQLVYDAYRFVMYHKQAIEKSPLQAYVSALLFSPARSLVRRLFAGDEPKWITMIPGMGENWSACLQTIEAHRGNVYSVALSHDSSRLASGSMDKTVKIWDTSSGDCLQTLEGHTERVYSVAFSLDSTRLASASNDKTVKIWDSSSGKCLQTLNDHMDGVNSVAFSPNSAQLASASNDKTVRIWDASSGTCLQTLSGHMDKVYSVVFSPDSSQLASGSTDKTVKIWDASNGTCVQTLKGHSDSVNSVAFSFDSTRLASASDDRTVKIWDSSSGKCLQTLNDHVFFVTSVAFSHDSGRLVAGCADHTIKIWNVSSGEYLQTLEGHNTWVNSVAFSHDSTRIVSGSHDRTVKIWDASSSKHSQTLDRHESWICSVTFSPDLAWFASASDDRTVKIWDASSGKCLQTLEGHTSSVWSVAFSPDSTTLATASAEADMTVKIWNAHDGTCLKTLRGHRHSVLSVAFSPDSMLLASGSHDSTVKIWSVGSGNCFRTLIGHEYQVSSVAFSPTSAWLASASDDNTVRIWDTSSGDCLQMLEGHLDNAVSVAFSRDSTRLASASDDKTVKIWDMSSGVCLQTIEVGNALHRLSFDGIGSCLYTSIGTIVINALPVLSTGPNMKLQVPRYQGWGLSSDEVWITYNSENLVWLPSEYRPSHSAVSENLVGIGAGTGKVWMCSFDMESSQTL